jgi:predicted NBD/HSP70 family sugar kinase
LVKNSNAVWVNGKPLKNDLEKALNREVRLENDANCFAVSEAIDGAAAGAEVVFGVIIGTGCGAGVVVNGKPLSGVNGIGGEWGHNPLPYMRMYMEGGEAYKNSFAQQDMSAPVKGREISYFTDQPEWDEYPGVQCYCGHQGCQETWISGTGFKFDYQRVEGEDISTHDIVSNAKQGEPRAVFALERYADRLARALSVVMNVIDPDVIVLGGGMSNVDELYEMVPAIWKRYVFSDIIHTKLVPPRYGDSSGVRGAAWLWKD